MALVAMAIGAGTAGCDSNMHAWLEFQASAPASEVIGSTMVLARWPHENPPNAGKYSSGVTVGRLKTFLTPQWLGHVLGDARTSVASLRVHKVMCEWHEERLDAIVVKGLQLMHEFSPKEAPQRRGKAARRAAPDAQAARDDRSDHSSVDWEAAVRPCKRAKRVVRQSGDALASCDNPSHALFSDIPLLEPDGDAALAARHEAEIIAARDLGSSSGDANSDSGTADWGSGEADSETEGSSAHDPCMPNQASQAEALGSDVAPERVVVAPPPAQQLSARWPRGAGVRPPPRETDAPWEKRPVYSGSGAFLGYITFDERHKQLDAQCGALGHRCSRRKCHVHRVLAKTPLGYLMAWLMSAPDHATRDSHFDARLHRHAGGALSFDARVRAREVARAQPALRLFFDLEREQHPGSGEIEEPPVLS